MRKVVLIGFLSIGVFISSMILFAPAKFGSFVYENATDLEASSYGLETKVVKVDFMNMSIYANNEPKRESVLLLHGYSADKDVWVRFSQYLTGKYNVIIPDMAGHGETGYSKSWDFSGPAQAERLKQLLDAQNIEKVHVIGNSMGGFIATHFTKMYPERVTSLAVMDPSGIDTPQQSPVEKLINGGMNPFIMHTRADFDAFYPTTMAKPPFVPDFILEAISEKYISRKDELMNIFKHIHHKDMIEGILSEIQAPTFLMWGEADQIIDVSGTMVWHASIPGLKVKTWPGVGHMPMVEIPEQSASEYQAFLTGL